MARSSSYTEYLVPFFTEYYFIATQDGSHTLYLLWFFYREKGRIVYLVHTFFGYFIARKDGSYIPCMYTFFGHFIARKNGSQRSLPLAETERTGPSTTTHTALRLSPQHHPPLSRPAPEPCCGREASAPGTPRGIAPAAACTARAPPGSAPAGPPTCRGAPPPQIKKIGMHTHCNDGIM